MSQAIHLGVTDVIDAFRAAMVEKGIPVAGDIIPDGTLHRIHVNGDHKGTENGWYILFADDRPAGQFGCNKRFGPDERIGWSMKGTDAKPRTPEERQAMNERIEQQRAEKAQAEKARRAEAAERAKAIWDAATPAEDHPYLERKGVRAHGLRVGPWEKTNRETGEVWRVCDDALLVPMKHVDDQKKIVSLQAIYPAKLMNQGARDKDYLKDGEKRGVLYPIGKPQQHEGKDVFVLAEGYATAATVHEATGHLMLVCFDAVNLPVVAQAIRKRQPEAVILIAADNDQWTEQPVKNPGVHYARQAGEAVGGLVAIPPIPADADGLTDFNDYGAAEGNEAVAAIIQQALEGVAPLPSESSISEIPGDETLNYDAMPATAAHGDAEEATVRVLQKHEFPDLNEKLKPINTARNLSFLMQHCGIAARYNAVSKDVEIDIPGHRGTRENEQNVKLTKLGDIAIRCGLSREHIAEHVKVIADVNTYNPVLQWITSKPWDGKNRIDELAATVRCKEHEFFRTVLLRRWLISAVAAVAYEEITPEGDNADTRMGFWSKAVLTFQGNQDLGKTSWFRKLVPASMRAFLDGELLDPGDKDSVIRSMSHWIVELGELDGTLKRDIAALKAFITKREDTLRRPFDRLDTKYPRRTVFCASVNGDKFLRDDTGNGRFWVVEVEQLDHEHDIDMQQLWAEALELYKSGEQWHLTSIEKAQLDNGNERFRQVDPIEELIMSSYDFNAPVKRWVTASRLLIEIGYDRPSRSQATLAGNVLRKLDVPSRMQRGRSEYCVPEKLETSRFSS